MRRPITGEYRLVNVKSSRGLGRLIYNATSNALPRIKTESSRSNTKILLYIVVLQEHRMTVHRPEPVAAKSYTPSLTDIGRHDVNWQAPK